MSKTTQKPTGRLLDDRILVKMVEEQDQIVGGIVIPDSAKEKPQAAEVVLLGSGKIDDNGKVIPLRVKVGDRVIISKYGGTEMKLGEQKYYVDNESDIIYIF